MQQIQVLDRTFELYLSYEQLRERISAVAASIRADLEGDNPLFIVMLNGAYMFAAELMRDLDFPAELSFVKMSSYQGTGSTGEVAQLIGLRERVAGREVVIVEDIVESGLTMKVMTGMLERRGATSVRIATLFSKPRLMKYDIHPDYVGLEIDDDFIVGFGLDYNGYGRNLKDIYKLKQTIC